MIKVTYTCDCCLKEIEDDRFSLDLLVHVKPEFNRLTGHCKVIDGKMLSISGRTEKMIFCLPCYNELFSNFFEKIKEIRATGDQRKQEE